MIASPVTATPVEHGAGPDGPRLAHVRFDMFCDETNGI